MFIPKSLTDFASICGCFIGGFREIGRENPDQDQQRNIRVSCTVICVGLVMSYFSTTPNSRFVANSCFWGGVGALAKATGLDDIAKRGYNHVKNMCLGN